MVISPTTKETKIPVKKTDKLVVIIVIVLSLKSINIMAPNTIGAER